MNKLKILKLKQNLYAIKLKLKKPVLRDNNVIFNEYGKYWSRAISHNNIIVNSDPNEITEFRYNGKYHKTTFDKYTKLTYDEFLRFIKNSCDYDDPIIELGCGTGSKLFYLEDHGFTNLKGYELTESGVKKAHEFIKLRNSKIKIQQHDILKKDIDIAGKTVITFLSIEQLKLNLEFIVDKIIGSKPKQVLSFESIFSSRFEKYYAEYSGYQTDYINLLNNKKQIVLQDIEEFQVNSNLLRPIYFMRWTIQD